MAPKCSWFCMHNSQLFRGLMGPGQLDEVLKSKSFRAKSRPIKGVQACGTLVEEQKTITEAHAAGLPAEESRAPTSSSSNQEGGEEMTNFDHFKGIKP